MANVLSLVSYKVFPAKTGGQKGIALFNKYFSKEVSLRCVTVKSNDPSYAPYPVMNVLSDSQLRYVNILYFFTLKNLIRKHNITHLLIEHPYYGWLAALLKRACGVKLVVHSHNIEALRFKTVGKWWWKILYRYEQWVYKQADITFAITEEDRQFMIKDYKLPEQKTTVITYGIEIPRAPAIEERMAAKRKLCQLHSISEHTPIFLFNGTLNYPPNLEGLQIILDTLNPLLFGTMDYRIIICGKDLPQHLNKLEAYKDKNVVYAGFVDDIDVYFKGADVFLNPVNEGGGIKTKLVEALAFGLTVISTKNGAIGVDPNLCNGKLLITENNNWKDFAEKMKTATANKNTIPPEFFDHFYWGHIAAKAATAINSI